jgi:ribokinase
VSDLVVVGSVNADLVVRVQTLPAPGETVTRGTFERHGGGKGANQAVAAARLGARVALIAAVGADDLGAEAVAALERDGVDCSRMARLEDAPTGVALIVVDAAGENQIAVASGANARLNAALVQRGWGEATPGGRRVVLLGLEIPDEAVLAGARAGAEAGARLVLNPAPARPLPEELLDLGPLLTPNEAEARALTGAADADEAARALADRTGAPVVVTLGARGALLVAPGQDPAPVEPLCVDAVDTTGAGDTFSGALAAELAAGAELAAAARFAAVAAALSTQAAGARDGMPDRSAVEAALR